MGPHGDAPGHGVTQCAAHDARVAGMEAAGHAGTGDDIQNGAVTVGTARLLTHIGVEVYDGHASSIPAGAARRSPMTATSPVGRDGDVSGQRRETTQEPAILSCQARRLRSHNGDNALMTNRMSPK